MQERERESVRDGKRKRTIGEEQKRKRERTKDKEREIMRGKGERDNDKALSSDSFSRVHYAGGQTMTLALSITKQEIKPSNEHHSPESPVVFPINWQA